MNNRIISLMLPLLIQILLLGHHFTAGSSWWQIRGGAEDDDHEEDDDLLLGNKFVLAAPLIVAAVCSDGIVMMATHTSYLQEPLLLQIDVTMRNGNATLIETTDNTTAATESNSANSTSTANHDITDTAIHVERQDSDNSTSRTLNITFPNDIPLNFQGPFRIQTIDSVGSTIMCAGWRTDGDWLIQKCRDLAKQEMAKFGPITPGLDYGRYMAQQASLFMAQCAVSEQLRPLGCAALFAVGGDDRSPGGYLWLIDATGAYRVRAHALGLGSATVNQALCSINFSNVTKEEAASLLLETIMTPVHETTNTDLDVAETILDSNALIEAAVLDSAQQRMIRVRQPFLGLKHLSAFVPAFATASPN